ncbi:MAG: hypothetical protein Kow00109_17710 [Acidobacteriota bacterium]
MSIVIPAHNAAAYLPRCLEALRRNDLRSVEVLVVDDGSSDTTAAVAESFATALPLQLFRLPENRGPAAARNLGADRAKHPYLLFLDADVVLPERALFWFRDTLDLYRHRPEVVGVLGAYAERIPSGDFWSDYRNLTTSYLYRATDTWSPFLHTAAVCLKREVFEEFGGFDESLRQGEDFQLGVRMGSRGLRLIIDRRIQLVHLKRYRFAEVLREDWSRVQHLQQMRLEPEARKFAWRAHRWNRLFSLLVPPGLGASLLVGFAGGAAWGAAAAAVLAGGFGLAHVGYWRFLVRRRGAVFAARAYAAQLMELACADVALAWSLVRPSALLRPRPLGDQHSKGT